MLLGTVTTNYMLLGTVATNYMFLGTVTTHYMLLGTVTTHSMLLGTVTTHYKCQSRVYICIIQMLQSDMKYSLPTVRFITRKLCLPKIGSCHCSEILKLHQVWMFLIVCCLKYDYYLGHYPFSLVLQAPCFSTCI